jgi:hypothetical protein
LHGKTLDPTKYVDRVIDVDNAVDSDEERRLIPPDKESTGHSKNEPSQAGELVTLKAANGDENAVGLEEGEENEACEKEKKRKPAGKQYTNDELAVYLYLTF